MIQKGSSSAFSSSQCKHHWNALISYLSFSIWPLNPIKVVSIASLLSHEALFYFSSLQNPLLSRFSLTCSFFGNSILLRLSDKSDPLSFFPYFSPLPVSYTFKLFHCHLRLFCSHPLLFFNLHAPYFCHPFSPPFLSPDFLIFTSVFLPLSLSFSSDQRIPLCYIDRKIMHITFTATTWTFSV